MNLLVTYTEGHTNEFRARDRVHADRMIEEYKGLSRVVKIELVHQQSTEFTWER